MLQGVTSFHELATPIMGRLRSSSFSPIARNIDRCGARSGPSVTAQLRCLSLRSAIAIRISLREMRQHSTAVVGLTESWITLKSGCKTHVFGSHHKDTKTQRKPQKEQFHAAFLCVFVS